MLGMNADKSRHVPTPPILRWVFRHDGMRLICRVDRQTSGRYALVIVPEGAGAKSLGRVTIYSSAAEAAGKFRVWETANTVRLAVELVLLLVGMRALIGMYSNARMTPAEPTAEQAARGG